MATVSPELHETLERERKIVQGARLILEGLGVDLADHNFATTPERMLKVYKELCAPPELHGHCSDAGCGVLHYVSTSHATGSSPGQHCLHSRW
jgi:hypothetical protein